MDLLKENKSLSKDVFLYLPVDCNMFTLNFVILFQKQENWAMEDESTNCCLDLYIETLENQTVSIKCTYIFREWL